ncbi:choice-of-anchor J domain-containing protein [Bacteroides congonensis]|uniref:choice-of-anchor J domain-containing protein n=1 Tax=Bacteroides congonensis TaxID=1871006 RepID=UPI00267495C1|nr:choice-of-anchor J domain-containing protein [Bacteroides congonensis]
MKKNILFSMFAGLLLLASCDYNEDNFPGYDDLTNATDVQNVTLTLEDAEYKTIAGIAANKELALSKDPEGETYAKALEAVGKNKFFTEDAPAAWYLPAYINDKHPYLSDGSKVTVNYNNFEELPEYLKDFNSVSKYDLTSDDYKAVWGETVSASFLSPSTVRQIPDLLAEAVKNPADGAMRLVNYAYSETEPSTGGGGEEPEPTYTNIAEAINSGAGTYDVKGEVVAANAKSILVKDDTGIIMVYLNALPTYSLGDVVTVSGDINSRNPGEPYQFSGEVGIAVVERKTAFEYPASPRNMLATDMENYLTNQSVEYITYEGTLTISNGRYFNVAIEGTTTAMGSIQYPIAIDNDLDGKKVKVTGYAVSASSGKYVNTIATSVALADGTGTVTTPVGLIALSEAGTYTTRGVVAAIYTKGFMLTDGTGNILVYENKVPTSKIGDIVSVSGTTSKYNGLMQFAADGLLVKRESEGSTSVNGLIAQDMDGIAMDAYLDAPRAVYATYTGILTIKDSGKGYNYYDVEIDGATTAKGSFSYVDESTIDASLNGKQVIVRGYLIGTKSGAVNTMVTSVEEATATNLRTFGMTRASGSTPNTSAVYRYDASTTRWKAYTSEAAGIAVLQPADYTSIGSKYVSKPAETLPVYLKQNYPYAKKDDVMAVVYYSNSDLAITATEFVYDGAVWTQTTVSTPSVIVFLKSQGVWTEAKVYYSCSFLNDDDGGFFTQDVELSDLKSVWKLDKAYGWKGSGYSGGNKVTESWLVSPEISLKKSALPVLKFDIAINYLNDGELAKNLNVMISTNYAGDVTEADWTELTVEGMPAGDSWDFSTVTPVDLSAYKDQNIRIAFRYRSDLAVATTTEIKNLSIQE